jgi:hypothetical protein
MTGQLLLHYRVVEKSVRVDRALFIKVLPPDLTDSVLNLKRFEREANLASSLE